MARYTEYYYTLLDMFEAGKMSFAELLEDDKDEHFTSDTIQKHIGYGDKQERVVVNLMEETDRTETVRVRLYLDGVLADEETFTVQKS